MTNGQDVLTWQQRLKGFTKRNLVMIVMVPAMVCVKKINYTGNKFNFNRFVKMLNEIRLFFVKLFSHSDSRFSGNQKLRQNNYHYESKL